MKLQTMKRLKVKKKKKKNKSKLLIQEEVDNKEIGVKKKKKNVEPLYLLLENRIKNYSKKLKMKFSLILHRQ